jgi:hypothetical protein
MDHYRKISSRLIENAILPNEIRISSATGKPAGVIQKIQSLIHEHKEGVVISASGSHMTKAIEIIEHIKRKKSDTCVYQHPFEIYYSSIEDTWEPDIQGLDTLKVIRSIPSLRVRLSLSTTDNDILIQQVDNKKKKQQKQQQ